MVGGLALGSVAAARRTASSFSTFLAATNPSDLTIIPAGGLFGYSPAVERGIARLPHVAHVESYVAMQASFLGPNGHVLAADSSVILAGSVNGLLFNQDRLSITSGRLANPSSRDEVDVTQTAASVLEVHVGESLGVELASRTGSGATHRLRLRIVGVGVLNREVVQDQIAHFPTYVIATPALTRSIIGDAAIDYFGVQVRGGPRYVPAVEREFTTSFRYFTDFELASELSAQASQAIRPESLALGVFGAIAGLAALLVAIQAIERQLRSRDEELRVLRSLGAGPSTVEVDGLIGVLGSILAGSMLAVGVAVALSPLAPIGAVRFVYPDPGVSADWPVLGIGSSLLVLLLSAVAVVSTYRFAPHRMQHRSPGASRRSATIKLLRESGLPLSAVTGAQFALDRGRGRTASPTRWTLVGGVVAVTVVAATLTFGASLHTLVSEPRLFGWNWDYAVQTSDGYGPVPNQAVATLTNDRAVAATSGVWFATMQLDGVEVPLLIASPNAPVSPPIVSGHGIEASNQIVLGASTLAALHAHVGGDVDMRFAPTQPPTPIRLRVVGVATMPAIGIAESLHTSMAVGAIVPADNGVVTEMLGPKAYPGCNGPNMVLIRLRPGVGEAAGRAAATRLANASNAILSKASQNSNSGGNESSVLSVQLPAQISDYKTMGSTPVLMAGGLALGAVVALFLTLMASVQRRRRDLALLKTLGFTRRQLAATVAWQASISAVVGGVVGIPLGTLLGRWLWSLFAREIGAVPAPTTPILWLFFVAVIALVLANLVAAGPGRSAARTPTAQVLRDE